MTSLGDRLLKKVSKLRWRPWSDMTSVKKKESFPHRGKHTRKTPREHEGGHLKAKESPGAYPSFTLLTITPSVWTLSLQKSEVINFSCSNHQLVVFCYSSSSKLIQTVFLGYTSHSSVLLQNCPSGALPPEQPLSHAKDELMWVYKANSSAALEPAGVAGRGKNSDETSFPSSSVALPDFSRFLTGSTWEPSSQTLFLGNLIQDNHRHKVFHYEIKAIFRHVIALSLCVSAPDEPPNCLKRSS